MIRPFTPAQLTPAIVTRRRMNVLSFVLFTTSFASLLMADLLWGSPFAGWGIAVWVLFTTLFGLVAFGAAHAFFGYSVRRRGGDPWMISRSLPPALASDAPLAPTAIVFPVFNEEVARICSGIEAVYRSLARTGQLERFDFFVLSDSTDPDQWVEEELGWARLIARLGAGGRLFYRRRRVNSNKKAGNIADFCRRWGRRYRYMIVFDADSVMTGDSLVRLVRLMERNPRVGLIQTAPALVRAQTLFARVLQFSSHAYGPIFQAGLNYWQLGEGTYWGHNAIIRLAPFISHCALPDLPGREPFGGKILSHDFVEAVLLRRAGWQVWLATDVGGSFEETPPTLIDFAKRDRRWCQGNLQHTWILFARGLHTASRVHLFAGIFSYASSLLWLCSLALGSLLAVGFARTGLTWLPDPGLAGFVGLTAATQAAVLTGFTFALLFAPKALSFLDMKRRPGGAAAFGGRIRLAVGMTIECLLSILLAPILMLFHAKFVVMTILGRGVRWATQRRDAFTSWREAARTHAGHTVVGIAWVVLMAVFAPRLLPWLAPVLLGLLLAIPFSQITSRSSIGRWLRRHGLLVTPEEIAPSRELGELEAALGDFALDASRPAFVGLVRAVVEPRTNALHCSLQRDRGRQPDVTRGWLAILQEKLLHEGPAALDSREKFSLLYDAASMRRLHREVWARPASDLAPDWPAALAAAAEAGETEPRPAAAVVRGPFPTRGPAAPETGSIRSRIGPNISRESL